MRISGMSGNEIYCLGLKGLEPGEIAVGNSVASLGIAGALSSVGRSIAGGEITQITELISDGRHRAIARMEHEAQTHGAIGVSGVSSTLGSLGGYTEFLAQGTGVHATGEGAHTFFSSAASGIELYCHLDTGYVPRKFVMGNVAYALGLGRGISGSFRTLARGEVHEFSSMYNEIRHTCLSRLRMEAANAGANAVVDVKIDMLPYGPGTVELLMTGTASHHAALADRRGPANVVTSELSGEELWNLAAIGLVPHQIVMATSVYSLGLAGNIGSMFRAMSKGELPELTKLVYDARENCLELVRRDATNLGAERVIGNRLQIREIGSGLIEIVAIGTAVRRMDATTQPLMRPASPTLIVQAVITEKSSAAQEASIAGMSAAPAAMGVARGRGQQGGNPILGLLIMLVFMVISCAVSGLATFFGQH